MKGMMNLVITLGIFTAVIGAILGTFFGVSLFDLEIPAKLKEFMIVGKIGETTYDKQMLLALIIGAVHICIAMTVKAVVTDRSFRLQGVAQCLGMAVAGGGIYLHRRTFFL